MGKINSSGTSIKTSFNIQKKYGKHNGVVLMLWTVMKTPNAMADVVKQAFSDQHEQLPFIACLLCARNCAKCFHHTPDPCNLLCEREILSLILEMRKQTKFVPNKRQSCLLKPTLNFKVFFHCSKLLP